MPSACKAALEKAAANALAEASQMMTTLPKVLAPDDSEWQLEDAGSLMELLDLMDGYALQTQRAITIPLIKSMLENT